MRNNKNTRRKLLRAAKEHINKYGFKGLNSNQLSIKVNMKHDVVQRVYQGMNNLIKAYIISEDYWKELFEQYTMPQDSAEQEVRQMFIDILQANFDKLFAHKGMQHVIWRQAGENCTMMRRISEAREKDGAPFLALTDKFFTGRKTDFRTVVMYVLGGTYYMMNHASNNKSTIVGRDINRPDHRNMARKTIEEIIKKLWLIE
ncbi:hypothetical protein [Pedobacter africanus]|uniref:Transcriptional regulator, TetR family n=1 Tax=Pedobacter africanus TaxID=151894 RepID=A0A1W1Z677_9SPHI|nr:hypothetical protein [Pedobacter africanus]SMC43884.1 hypothetical protein SAMN04488524_0410 [Pedobacter africanus]